MKRKLFVAGLVLLVPLSAYSIAAWWMLRGAGAYRMGTTLGSVLSGSRPYTSLAAAALFLALAAGTALHLRRRKQLAAQAEKKTVRLAEGQGEKAHLPSQEETERLEETEKLQPAGPAPEKTELLEEDGKIPPAGPDPEKTELLKETEKIPPAGPAASETPDPAAEAGTLQPRKPSAEAGPVPAAQSVPPSGAAAEPLPEAPAPIAAPPVPAGEPASSQEGKLPPAGPAEAGKIPPAMADLEKTEILADTETFSPPPAETADKIPPAAPPENVPAGGMGTVPPAPAPPPARPAPWPRFCGSCGAALQPGQRFCARCGTQVRGGGV